MRPAVTADRRDPERLRLLQQGEDVLPRGRTARFAEASVELGLWLRVDRDAGAPLTHGQFRQRRRMEADYGPGREGLGRTWKSPPDLRHAGTGGDRGASAGSWPPPPWSTSTGPRADPGVRRWACPSSSLAMSPPSTTPRPRRRRLSARRRPLQLVIATWAVGHGPSSSRHVGRRRLSPVPRRRRLTQTPTIAAWPAIDDFLLVVSRLDQLDACHHRGGPPARGARARTTAACAARGERCTQSRPGGDETTLDRDRPVRGRATSTTRSRSPSG